MVLLDGFDRRLVRHESRITNHMGDSQYADQPLPTTSTSLQLLPLTECHQRGIRLAWSAIHDVQKVVMCCRYLPSRSSYGSRWIRAITSGLASQSKLQRWCHSTGGCDAPLRRGEGEIKRSLSHGVSKYFADGHAGSRRHRERTRSRRWTELVLICKPNEQHCQRNLLSISLPAGHLP